MATPSLRLLTKSSSKLLANRKLPTQTKLFEKKNASIFKLPTKTFGKLKDLDSAHVKENSTPPEESESSLNSLLKRRFHDDGESIWLLSYSDMMTLLFGFFVMMMSFSKVDLEQYEKTRKSTAEYFGGDYQKPTNAMASEIKNNFRLRGVGDKALFDEFENGIVLTFNGSTFFDSASAELRPEAEELLMDVIPSIKQQQSMFYVVVEGHTDDNPIQSPIFPSNWELSSQRASTVVRLFENQGFPRSHLRSIGFSDTLPVLPNRDSSNKAIPDNQAKNRRVVVKLIRARE